MLVLLALLMAAGGCMVAHKPSRMAQSPSLDASAESPVTGLAVGGTVSGEDLGGKEATSRAAPSATPAPASPAKSGAQPVAATETQPDRMLIWKAALTVEVDDVKEAAARATVVTEKAGGYVEQKSDSGEKDDKSACLTIRVPADKFKSAVAGLENLGTVTDRNVTGQDVTEQYVDVEARLKNKIVLRDRLQKLLDRADAVKDILSIETELNRVQGDIDSMTAQLKALKGRVDYATITLSLQRKQVLGPIGFVGKWVVWAVEKLFIIRE
jgi:hypothetical protein